MEFSDFCRTSQCTEQYAASSLETCAHWRKDWIAVVVFVGAPALTVSRIGPCRRPVPRPYAALRSIERPRWYRDRVNLSDRDRCEEGERDELFEVGHLVSS